MYRHTRTITYIIFGLLAIGILTNIRTLWLPLLIFGIVFYLYKFPPKQLQQGQRNRTYRPSGSVKQTKKKTFRVIKGSKKDDDNETPKFH